MTTTSQPTSSTPDHTRSARPGLTGRTDRRRLPVALAVAGSLLAGLAAALVLALVVFAGGTEPVITAALVGSVPDGRCSPCSAPGGPVSRSDGRA